jgi:uncharacterized protein (DUF4415 family)
MNANKPFMAPILDDIFADDAPDLSTPYWAAKIAAAPIQRGRPRAAAPKVSTTIRLDADVLAAFKSQGAGWQSRINAALRKAADLP